MDAILAKYGAFIELKIVVEEGMRDAYENYVQVYNQKLFDSTTTSTIFVDDGFDLFTPDRLETVERILKVNFGVKIQATYIAENTRFPCGVKLYARSSIYKTPLRLANGVGVIDSGYRGDMIGMFDILPIDRATEMPVTAGSRIVQLCATSEVPFFVKLVTLEELSQTNRGENGFGSTG
jgi:dUTP pyrophosphatase